MARRSTISFVAAGSAVALLIGAQLVLDPTSASASGLTNYGDCDEFLDQQRRDLRARATAYGIDGTSYGIGYGGTAFLTMDVAAQSSAEGDRALSAPGGSKSSSGTGTNLQEQGVDEPDLAKLADGRIVVVSNGALTVLSAGRTPAVLGRMTLSSDRYGYGADGELLLMGERALVIRATSRPVAVDPTPTPAPTTPPTTTAAPTPAPTPAPSTPTPTPTAPPTDTPTPPSSPPAPTSTASPTEIPPTADTPAPDLSRAESAPQAAEPADGASSTAADAPVGMSEPTYGPPDGTRVVPATRLMLVDLSQGAPRLIEERVQDGMYISARLVDSTVRLVTRSLPAVAAVSPYDSPSPALRHGTAGPSELKDAENEALRANQQIAATAPLEAFLPQFSRTDATGATIDTGTAVSCESVAHATDGVTGGMVTVTTMRPAADLAATDTDAVATDADTVYAATDRLYIATSRWPGIQMATVDGRAMDIGQAIGPSATSQMAPEVTTEIHSFDTSHATATSYVASGSVPGYILGRWALSRHEGTLRVATTSEPFMGGQERASESMLVKLDEQGDDLVETGRVEGLGKGERITAVRYFGDIASVVTFRQVDPLYLVDLSGTPTVTGELKIPGYSTYLHPIGDDLLLGVGYDGTEEGTITGLQVSTFDVSDRSSPRLVARLPVGIRAGSTMGGGDTSSPALDDSRAFAYDAERRQLLLPLTTYDYSALNVEQPSVLSVTVDATGQLSTSGSLAMDPRTWGSPQRVLLDGGSFHAVGSNGIVTADVTAMTATSRLGLTPTTP